jgi:hypothetical protein
MKERKMPKFEFEVVRYSYYYVEADNIDEAEDLLFDDMPEPHDGKTVEVHGWEVDDDDA